MNAEAKSVQQILYAPCQFQIPFFQRHYSWKVSNWQTLWDDLKALAAHAKPRQHFLGPLVCTPVHNMPGDVPNFMLIDGQQRLTTLTVVLAALRDAAQGAQLPELAQQITESYLIHKFQKDLKRYKVVPRVGDRQVLFRVIDGEQAQLSRRDGIVQAYKWFQGAIGEYIREDAESKIRQLLGLATGQLSLVVVNITDENPYEIFESLNVKGLPLEESDLIRNFVFMQVRLDEQAAFNDQHWQPFEAMFDETEHGPAVLPTAFYRDYLMRNGEYSRKKETFIGFKDMLRSGSWTPVELVKKLQKYASYELMLRRPASCPSVEFQRAFQRIELLKLTTAHPLIMHLLALVDDGRLTPEDLLGCLHDLESFIVRRSICGESSRGYGPLLSAAIKAVKDNPREDLRKYWASKGWPDDDAFAENLVTFQLYRREPSKCLLILRTLEESFGHKEQADLSKLSIEHVMPRSIEDDKHGKLWKEMLGEHWEREHEQWLNTLGNLTLTGYNSNLSNKAFDRKKVKLAESNLQLNKDFGSMTAWDAKSIGKRAKSLAAKLVDLWERPEGLAYAPSPDDDQSVGRAEETSEEGFSNKEYWLEFLEVLGKAAPELKPKAVKSKPTLIFPIEDGLADYMAVALDDEQLGSVSVQLSFTGKNRESSLSTLQQAQIEVDKELGIHTEWVYDDPCSVVAYLDAARVDDRTDWPRQHAWLAATLQKFYQVFIPRTCTPSNATDFKKLSLAFWTAFDLYLAEQHSGIELGKVKPQGWRNLSLQDGVGLWMNFVPEEHWLGAGLEFSGKKGLAMHEVATKYQDQFATAVRGRVFIEDENQARYLSTYLLIQPLEKNRWPSYHEWLAHVLRESKILLAEVVQAGLDRPVPAMT